MAPAEKKSRITLTGEIEDRSRDETFTEERAQVGIGVEGFGELFFHIFTVVHPFGVVEKVEERIGLHRLDDGSGDTSLLVLLLFGDLLLGDVFVVGLPIDFHALHGNDFGSVEVERVFLGGREFQFELFREHRIAVTSRNYVLMLFPMLGTP